MAVRKKRKAKKDYLSYVCPYCFNQLHKCTCEIYPPWSLVQIDLNMQEIIRELNNKGYATMACCESHYGDGQNIYVLFARDYDLQPPEGFTFKPKHRVVERIMKFKNKESYESEKTIYLEKLTTWAKELPDVCEKISRL